MAEMTDINELRRLALDGDLAAMQEIILRLEAAEKERDALRAALQHEADCMDAAKAEIEALRAKIEQMEKQEPAGYGVLYVEAANGEEDWDSIWKHRVFAEDHVKDFVQAYPDLEESVGAITVVPLYLAPGAVRHEANCVEACKAEVETLRARVEAMERQEPVGKFTQHPSNGLWEQDGYGDNPDASPLYALPGAQQCKNCNGMGDRFDPSGEKIPCDLCESNLEEIRVLVAEAVHDIVSGSDFWLSTSLTAKKICALPGAKGE